MASVKRKNSDIQFFLQYSKAFIMENPDHKFNDKILKQGRRMKDLDENFKEDSREISYKHCETNEKGHIIYDTDAQQNRQFIFSKEGIGKFNKEMKVLNNKIVSFDLTLNETAVLEAGLLPHHRDYFLGFINDFKD